MFVAASVSYRANGKLLGSDGKADTWRACCQLTRFALLWSWS
jgi:hypothetical protein